MTYFIDIERYLYITKSGTLRMSVKKGQVKANEVRLALKIRVPSTIFDRYEPSVTVQLPDRPFGDEIPVETTLQAAQIADQIDIQLSDFSDELRDEVMAFLTQRHDGVLDPT